MAVQNEVTPALGQILRDLVTTEPIKASIVTVLQGIKVTLLQQNAVIQAELTRLVFLDDLLGTFRTTFDSEVSKLINDINILPFKTSSNNGQMRRLLNGISFILSPLVVGSKQISYRAEKYQREILKGERKLQEIVNLQELIDNMITYVQNIIF